jgi:hypothetical protein
VTLGEVLLRARQQLESYGIGWHSGKRSRIVGTSGGPTIAAFFLVPDVVFLACGASCPVSGTQDGIGRANQAEVLRHNLGKNTELLREAYCRT